MARGDQPLHGEPQTAIEQKPDSDSGEQRRPAMFIDPPECASMRSRNPRSVPRSAASGPTRNGAANGDRSRHRRSRRPAWEPPPTSPPRLKSRWHASLRSSSFRARSIRSCLAPTSRIMRSRWEFPEVGISHAFPPPADCRTRSASRLRFSARAAFSRSCRAQKLTLDFLLQLSRLVPRTALRVETDTSGPHFTRIP